MPFPIYYTHTGTFQSCMHPETLPKHWHIIERTLWLGERVFLTCERRRLWSLIYSFTFEYLFLECVLECMLNILPRLYAYFDRNEFHGDLRCMRSNTVVIDMDGPHHNMNTTITVLNLYKIMRGKNLRNTSDACKFHNQSSSDAKASWRCPGNGYAWGTFNELVSLLSSKRTSSQHFRVSESW